MILLITGDRKWHNVEVIYTVLVEFYRMGYTTLIEGEAFGADTIGKVCAEEIGYDVIKVPAHWTHTKSCVPDCEEICGKRAGVIRNRKMVDMYSPTHIIAFHDSIKSSRGTRDMLQYAIKKLIPFTLYTSNYLNDHLTYNNLN